MSWLNVLGFGTKSLLSSGRKIQSVVEEVKTLWWIKVNTKPVRVDGMEGAIFPGFIRFSYSVEGIKYKGSRVISPYKRCPIKGEKIDVFYDADKPSSYAVNI